MTGPITQAEIDEAQALLAKAAAEPWGFEASWRDAFVNGEHNTPPDGGAWLFGPRGDSNQHGEPVPLWFADRDDAALIVLMRSMFPRLLAERREREAEHEKLKAAFKPYAAVAVSTRLFGTQPGNTKLNELVDFATRCLDEAAEWTPQAEQARAERAEAECARLREALEPVLKAHTAYVAHMQHPVMQSAATEFESRAIEGERRDAALEHAADALMGALTFEWLHSVAQALTPTPESGRTG